MLFQVCLLKVLINVDLYTYTYIVQTYSFCVHLDTDCCNLSAEDLKEIDELKNMFN